MLNYCKNCTISSNIPAVTIGEDGLCDYCAGRKPEEWDSKFGIDDAKKDKLKAKLEDIFEKIRGKSKYDCVLGLSGGKDSAFLLYHLLTERKLKVLAVHVKTPFVSKIADKNIRRLKERFTFDLKEIDPGRDFYIKVYSKLLISKLLYPPRKKDFTNSICGQCTSIYLGHCIKTATENNIPLVMIGTAPGQGNSSFFEINKDVIERKTWMAKLFESEEDKEFLSNFWDPFKYPAGTNFPMVIFPLQVMKYNIQNIYKILSENKILTIKMMNPHITNCCLIPFLHYLDGKHMGYTPDIELRAYRIRKGFMRRQRKSFANKVISTLLWERKKILYREIEKRLILKTPDSLKKLFP